jgi:hypothetical protein
MAVPLLSWKSVCKQGHSYRPLARVETEERAVLGLYALEEVTQEVHGRTPLLPTGSPHRHRHRLRSRPGPAAAPDLAQEDPEADRQLSPPVRCVQTRLAQELEQVVAMRPQMLGQALVGHVRLRQEDQVGQLDLQAACDLAVRQTALFVEFDDGGLGIRSQLGGWRWALVP